MEISPAQYTILATLVFAAAALRAVLYRKERLTGLFRFAVGVEVGVITLLLTSLVFLGCMQIVLRNFFHSGVLWADLLMRHVVLWLGCLGGALATTHSRHINIDVFSRLMTGRSKPVVRAVVNAVTAIVAFVLAIAALRLVIDERAFGDVAFGAVKTWMLQAVLPFAFFIISYRCLLNLFIARGPDTGDAPSESFESLETRPRHESGGDAEPAKS